MRSSRRVLVAIGASVAMLVGGGSPAYAVPEGDVPEAVYNYFNRPGYLPGGNDWTCKPTASHPNPVVLLPGTFANLGANFVKLAPRLKNEGFCVFGTNYGMTASSYGRVGGLAPIKTSAQEVDAFVSRVLTATGASKVDIVGHSQGGNVPMWWIKKMGGAAKTAHYVGMAPSSRGTTLGGIVELAEALDAIGFIEDFGQYLNASGVTDQMTTSQYTQELWAGGVTLPAGPKYTVIMSKRDLVVTPWQSQALPGANNILLQDRCWFDDAGHAGLFNDGPTMSLVVNALENGPSNYYPWCWDEGIQWL